MSLNVIVVDDSAVMRAMMIRTLRTSRVALRDIHEAADGEQALAELDAHWIDLALVDLNMPGMSGEELVRAIRADLPPALAAHLVRAHGAAFLQKPFTVEALRAAVEQLTGVRPVDGAHASAQVGRSRP